MRVKVAKWGNSLGVRLPKAAAEAAGLEAGTELDVTVEGADVRLKRRVRIPYYRLEDLLAEMDRLGPDNEPETVEWGPDRGAEIIDDAYSRGEITLDDILKRKPESAEGSKRSSPRRRTKRRTRAKPNGTSKRRRHRLG